MLNLEDIKKAHERIRGRINHTPVMTSRTIDKMTGCKVYFKCENFQRAGAFKIRGALNTILQLSEDEKRKGVVAHSSGNHAQAVALASSMIGIKATIVMPTNSPDVKVHATRGYGAEVVFCEPTVESRAKVAQELVKKHGYVLIHPYNDERIIAGAGTAVLELIKEVGPLDYIFGPVGGGGLISGTSIATKGLCPNSSVIAVEPKNADDAYRSIREGRILPSINPDTIADGLRTQLAELTFSIIQQNVDEIVTVSEDEIVDAMRLLWERMKLVVEPSGAVSFSGVFKKTGMIKKKAVGVIISGGNIDLTDFFNRIPT